MNEHVRANMIAEPFETHLKFPIKYVLHKCTGEFKISIYHEHNAGGTRSVNSDVPFATWLPGRGITQINHSPFCVLRDAGLVPVMEKFCQEAYDAWLEGEEEADEA